MLWFLPDKNIIPLLEEIGLDNGEYLNHTCGLYQNKDTSLPIQLVNHKLNYVQYYRNQKRPA